MRITIHSLCFGLLLLAAGQTARAQDGGIEPKIGRGFGEKACAPTFSRSRLEVPATGGAFSVRVTLPADCKSSVTYWTDSFISTPTPQDSRGSVTLSFRIATNDSKRRRGGKIKVTGYTDARKRSAYLNIVQAGRA